MQGHLLENRIYYRTNEFKIGRPTLVFIHGVSGSSSAWFPYEKIFEEKYNILSYDIRGHGLSKKYPNYGDYKIANFRQDLNELIEYLKIEKFILITNSFAGLIALDYLKSHKEKVVANIFTSPEIYLQEGFLANIVRPILFIITNILKKLPFNPKPRGQVDYSKHIGSTDWDIKRNWADMKNTGFRAHFFTLRQSLEKNQKYELDKISVPTLIIHGERDTMVSMKNTIRMSKEIKNSKFLIVPNADHNTVHNAVKEMTEAITSFLEGIK